MAEDIFAATGDTTTSTFDQLVGEGKKFKDQEALAKAKAEADAFIERLKSEQDQLRQELSTRVSVEDQLKKLNESRQIPNNTENAPSANTPPTDSQRPDVAAQVREALQQELRNQTSRTNVNAVSVRMTELLGDKVGDFVSSKATELGVSVKDLEAMASRSPEAFYRMVGVEGTQRPGTTAPPKADLNPLGALHQGGVREGSYEFYENIRRTNPTLYFTPKIQTALHKAFEDGVYNPPG